MEIPSSQAGVVKELRVKLGDKVGEGSVVLMLEASAASSPPPLGEGRVGAAVSASSPTVPPPQPSPALRERERAAAVINNTDRERSLSRLRGRVVVNVLVDSLSTVTTTFHFNSTIQSFNQDRHHGCSRR
jgi:pyruvate/2-oxoglutarate dehydrogenase complex dihydrolipoamide acyltransferase (E2) component